MKLVRGTLKAERMAQVAGAQALVEGEISPPAMKQDIENILSVQANVLISGSEVAESKIMLEGSVSFFVVYMDSEGIIDGFESATSFRHSIDAESAESGMYAEVSANVVQSDYTQMDKKRINAKAIINLNATLLEKTELNAVENVFDVNDVQMLKETISVPYVSARGKSLFNIKEDVKLYQGMPLVSHIIGQNACGSIKNAFIDTDKVAVEGEVKVNIFYMGVDAQTELQQAQYTIPFEHILALEAQAGDGKAIAKVDVNETYVQLEEQEGEQYFKVEMMLSVFADIFKEQSADVIKDVYSPTIGLSPISEEINTRALLTKLSAKSSIREMVALQSGMPMIGRTLMALASPNILSTYAADDKVFVEGVMDTTIVYLTREDIVKSFKTEVPFMLDFDAGGANDGMHIESDILIENVFASGSGDEIELKYNLDGQIRVFYLNSQNIVNDIEITEKEDVAGGITIYFADKDELVWDVLKKFNTTIENISKYNGEMSERDKLEEGQKILIFTKKIQA